jgi:hypothetical protein
MENEVGDSLLARHILDGLHQDPTDPLPVMADLDEHIPNAIPFERRRSDDDGGLDGDDHLAIPGVFF